MRADFILQEQKGFSKIPHPSNNQVCTRSLNWYEGIKGQVRGNLPIHACQLEDSVGNQQPVICFIMGKYVCHYQST